MPNSTTTLVPPPRPAERPCPIGCTADHHGELPGMRDHWTPVATIRTPDGVLLVDLSARDGEQPLVVVHDQDGNELRIADDLAVSVGNAILAAAGAR